MGIDYSSKASIGLVKRVPAGVFRMGSRFHPRENPPRLMQAAEFQIAHAPVTVSQYAVFIDSKANQEKHWWGEEGRLWLEGKSDGWGRENRIVPEGWEAQLKRPFRPIAGITDYEAEAYCLWLGAVKNRAIRLPTEVEWEYAACGDDGRPFPWGEIFEPRFANTAEAEVLDAVDAGSNSHDVSPFGVMDMCGNVQQWTSSTYIPLEDEAVPPGPLRVARGGSFNDVVFGARASYRRAYPPGFFYPFLGFRIVVGIV
jgi:formylglycine-generating enzyme required for sulfatase activity